MMISRYEVSLNGVDMASLNENLKILNVEYPAPEITLTKNATAGRDGARITRRYREAARVTVKFELHIYDIAQRQAACQDIARWAANGGALRINDRPDTHLNVICETLPSITSVRDWTKTLALEFAAYRFPYWEDDTETQITLSGVNTSGTVYVPGNTGADARALVSATITARANLTWVTVFAGAGTFIGLGAMRNGETVEIGYDDDLILYIRKGGTSILNTRNEISTDDLLAECGKNNLFTLQSNGAAQVTFRTRGCWY